MNYLVYVAHGAECFRQEAVYSILSFLRRGGAEMGEGTKVLVVTDAPESFERYLSDAPCVRYLPVTPAQLTAWRGGPAGYVHRIKPHAILHAARSADLAPADRLLFVDSDTAFQIDPAILFGRIAASEVLLNECEGRVRDLRGNTRSHRRLHDALLRHEFTVAGRHGLLPMTLPLWNSGIIGLEGARLGLFEETLALIDPMWATLGIAATEQVALSAVLDAHGIRPRETLTEVLHYHVFKEFRDDLAAFFAHHAGTATTTADWVRLSATMEPAVRIQPKLAFNRQPKWWRQLRKAFGRRWQPVPYPWNPS